MSPCIAFSCLRGILLIRCCVYTTFFFKLQLKKKTKKKTVAFSCRHSLNVFICSEPFHIAVHQKISSWESVTHPLYFTFRFSRPDLHTIHHVCHMKENINLTSPLHKIELQFCKWCHALTKQQGFQLSSDPLFLIALLIPRSSSGRSSLRPLTMWDPE